MIDKNQEDLKQVITDCFQEVLDMDNTETNIRFSVVLVNQNTMIYPKGNYSEILKDMVTTKHISKDTSIEDFILNYIGISVKIDFPKPTDIKDKSKCKEYWDFKLHLEDVVSKSVNRMRGFHKRTVSKAETHVDNKTNRISILIFPEGY